MKVIYNVLVTLLCWACLFLGNGYAYQNEIKLMPYPKSVSVGKGVYKLDEHFTVNVKAGSNRLVKYANRIFSRIRDKTGLFFLQPRAVSGLETSDLNITYQELGQLTLDVDESYMLKVSSKGIQLSAPTDIGAMRGLETLAQLLAVNESGYFFPVITIIDEPRFVWRGLLIDVGRHFMPVEVIKRTLDGMSMVKMNVLHWHLSEDQGFRIESKKFTKLQLLGSDGDYYTQEQAQEIVKYAADRGIRVVPEFDMPGHTTSWFVGYPDLASAPGPYSIGRRYGVFDAAMDPTREATYKFISSFLEEMTTIFPDEYLHIGGDENNGHQWDRNEDIQAFKKEKGLASNAALQAYFNQRLNDILVGLGKKMVGWDEILDQGLPRDIVIQSWRGNNSFIDAAEQGFDVILSHGYYLDLVEHADKLYLNDPLPGDSPISSQARSHVLGGEAAIWSELVTPETIDSRIWPRTAVVAERLWSPEEIRDIPSMYLREQTISLELETVGLTHLKNYEMMLRRMVGTSHIADIRILVDVLEPVKGYRRHRMRSFKPSSPYTRVADAARPESVVGREFNVLVDAYAQTSNEDLRDRLKDWLTIWYENNEKLSPTLRNIPALHEIIPLNKDLSSLSVIGLQALSPQKLHGEEWKSRADKVLKAASKPKAECLISIVRGIQKLVDLAGQ